MKTTAISPNKFANNTKRVYRQAIRDFKSVTGIEVSEAKQSHYELWVTNMKFRKLSASTIRQRISAISQTNPTLMVTLPKRELIEHICFDDNQLTALLSSIPTSHTGNFDFALIALSTAYGLKSSQIRNLRWNHFEERNDGLVFHLNKQRIVLHHSVKDLMKNLIKTEEKGLPNQDNYIFANKSERWRNLPNAPITKVGLLSSTEINRRLKKYARYTKLEERKLSVRAFKYTLDFLGYEKIIEIIESALKKRSPQPVSWESLSCDPRLHGLGRRSR